jgi:hypothetical protein
MRTHAIDAFRHEHVFPGKDHNSDMLVVADLTEALIIDQFRLRARCRRRAPIPLAMDSTTAEGNFFGNRAMV